MKKIIALLMLAVVLAFSACSQTTDVENVQNESDDIMCTQEYNPVCGVDGVTYGNSCMAQDVEIAYEGECVSEEQLNVFDSTQMEEEIIEIVIDSYNMGFSYDEIRVREGQTIRLTLTNSEGMHDFVVDELNATTELIETGETSTIEFVADTVGEFEYYCSYRQHRAMGMVGKFVVVEQ